MLSSDPQIVDNSRSIIDPFWQESGFLTPRMSLFGPKSDTFRSLSDTFCRPAIPEIGISQGMFLQFLSKVLKSDINNVEK